MFSSMSTATDTTPTIRDSRQALIDAIKAHMAREGLTRTGFGRAALGDASFLGRLGRGADVRFSTADKVLAFMGKEQWADPKQAIYRFRGADIAAYPSLQKIADAWSIPEGREQVGYFWNNRKHGITTYQDAKIEARLRELDLTP